MTTRLHMSISALQVRGRYGHAHALRVGAVCGRFPVHASCHSDDGGQVPENRSPFEAYSAVRGSHGRWGTVPRVLWTAAAKTDASRPMTMLRTARSVLVGLVTLPFVSSLAVAGDPCG